MVLLGSDVKVLLQWTHIVGHKLFAETDNPVEYILNHKDFLSNEALLFILIDSVVVLSELFKSFAGKQF